MPLILSDSARLPLKAFMMKTLPIDTVPCFCPTWEEIADKAHMYKTARNRTTGEYMTILHVFSGTEKIAPLFYAKRSYSEPAYFKTEELCDFCL